MKVVAFNGSPHKEGNTYYALKMVGDELVKQGIEFEVVNVGDKIIRGCSACGGCGRNLNERCVFTDDELNGWIQKMKEADGILLGSPVHYAGIGGTMKAFLDRAFFVTATNKAMLRHKVGAAVVSVRRSGGVTTFDQLNHYLTYAEMIMPTSNYWNVIHGLVPGEAGQDGEGNQIMRILGKNMAWLMKVIEAGKAQVPPVEPEEKEFTNFIR